MLLGFVQTVALWILPFLAVLTLVVTVHELGHYLVARACGVAVDRFSIGFGRALVKWRTRSGMEWRIGWIPFGGYVRFSGDESVASVPDADDLAALRREVLEREGPAALRRYYHFKPVWQRALVAVAGPAANMVLAIAVFSALALAFGVPTVLARVQGVTPGSAAAKAGFLTGDDIRAINGHRISSYSDVAEFVLLRAGEPLKVTIDRAGRKLELPVTPTLTRIKDPASGSYTKAGQLGLLFGGSKDSVKRLRFGPFGAVRYGVGQTVDIIQMSATSVAKIFAGRVSVDQLSGPVGIAGMSKAVASGAMANTVSFGERVGSLLLSLLQMAAFVSVAIGIANLLPIPVLDGGHLLFYGYEALARRPLAAKVQEVGYRVGFALLIGLMLFTTWNDLHRYRVFNFIGGLFS